MTKNIVLIGLMGCGKTTVGKLLAEKAEMKLVDTDALIVEKAGKSINNIFAEDGEPVFRDIEASVIKDVSEKENLVVSTGGGAVVREENIDNLKKNGVLFYLYAPAEKLYERIKGDNERPLIKTESPLATLQTLLKNREMFYMQADYKINTVNKTPDEITEEIIKLFAY